MTTPYHTTRRWEEGRIYDISADPIAPESPLAIWVGQHGTGVLHELAVTMRSPGDDAALALGYLFHEGIIHRAADVWRLSQRTAERVDVWLAEGVPFDPDAYARTGIATSSCGLCGKRSAGQLARHSCYFPVPGQPQVPWQVLQQLPEVLHQQQSLFSQTGGTHAAALFNTSGTLLRMHEDVGRHNALDKLAGTALIEGFLPWRQHILLMTSRISYELVQKAAMTGVPVLAAVGAPTSMAIELAEQAGITLVGFLRPDRFNAYTYTERCCSGAQKK